MLDGLVGQFILIVLHKILEFHLGNSHERLAGGNCRSKTKLGISVQDLVAKSIHLDILDLLIGDAAVKDDDLGGPRRINLTPRHAQR